MNRLDSTSLSDLVRQCVSASVFLMAAAFVFVFATANARAQGSADDLVNVVVILVTPSAAEVYVAESGGAAADAIDAAEAERIAAATKAQVTLVAAEQDVLAASLEKIGAEEIYRVQRAYNGIAVRVPASELDRVAALPQVAAVYPLIPKEIENAEGVPLIGAPVLWDAPFGLLGDGISIGIIDTGADYLHAGLGGPGGGYDENDVTIIGDVPGYPNWRVVGGFDFAGDEYNSNPAILPYNPVPNPDPDPADCYDHGTHVTATAGGNGVTAAGEAYAGPYTSALDFPEMRIGPGVAPHADLYALKVFGCAGSSEIVDLAIEWAMDPNGDGNFDDHLDVINMSLGSPVGNAQDMTALAAERAAQIGVIVVSSMGNSGDTFFTAGSPGVAQRSVTVGATRVEPTEQNDTIASFSARGPRPGDNLLKPDVSAPGVAIVSALNRSGNGAIALNGTSMATPFVSGSLALLRQQYPAWSVEELKALIMNTATVVRSDSGGAPYSELVSPPTRAGAGRIALQEAIRSGVVVFNADVAGGVSLSFGAPEIQGSGSALQNLRVVNKGAASTSWFIDYISVADFPGVEIELPIIPTITIGGGSSATVPILMRADAALMQNVPDPALPLDQNGEPRQWRSEEQGHLYLWESSGIFSATLSGADAYPPNTSGDSASASFVYSPETRVLSYTLASTDIGLESIERVAIERGLAGQTPAAEAYMLFEREGGPALTLPLTGSVTLEVSDVRLLASGYLVLNVVTDQRPTGAAAGSIRAANPVLKVPVHAAPQAVAAMRATTTTLDMGNSVSATRAITLTGTSLIGSEFPTETQSIVGGFELHSSSPRNIPSSGSTPAYADIKFVGVTSDWTKVADKEDARLYFALTTWGEWSSLLQTQFVVRIDTDRDDVSDYRVYSTDVANYSASRGLSDVFYTAVESLENGTKTLADPINGYSPSERLTAVYQNNVVVLSVPMRLLGVDALNSAFNFSIETILRTPALGETGDWVNWMQYDVRRPGIANASLLAGNPWRDATDGSRLTFNFNMVNFARSSARGVLLIHPFNAETLRAETLATTYEWPFQMILLPVTMDGFGQ